MGWRVIRSHVAGVGSARGRGRTGTGTLPAGDPGQSPSVTDVGPGAMSWSMSTPTPTRRTFPMLLAALLALSVGMPADAAPRRERARVSARAARAATNAQRRLGATLKAKGVAFGDEIYLRAFKEEALLELWMRRGERFELVRTYPVCAASGGLGPKLRVGDEQVPEGFYRVGAGAMNPASNYHLSFNVGYPNAFDRSLGRTGGLIMIHGDCVSIGCLAMTDAGIEEIYTLADAAHRAGQRSFAVDIFPFRMTAENLKRHGTSKWKGFWQNLRQGHDAFEARRVPPKVTSRDGRYVFSRD